VFRYAQILHDKAHWIFETNETLTELYNRFAPDMVFNDITSYPEIQEGWDYQDNKFTAPPGPTDEEKLADIRIQRDWLLTNSDKYIIPDYPLSEAERDKWREYRQALRDFPETCDIDNPLWPISPENLLAF